MLTNRNKYHIMSALVILAMVFGFTNVSSAAVQDTWTVTRPMAVAREDHTATLLPDGRVLVSGGLAGNRKTAPTVTIGVAAYLSGLGVLGWGIVNSVELAVDQANAAGGVDIGGTQYTLVLNTVEDGCDATQGVVAANTLLGVGAVAVVAHSCSVASMAAQPIYYAAGVAMVSGSSTVPTLTLQGYNTTFRTIPHDGSTSYLLASYFRNTLGLQKIAIVETTYSPWMGDYFASSFTALGGTITSRQQVSDPSEYTPTLLSIQAEDPDGIAILYDSAAVGGEFSKIAYNLGMTEVVIGSITNGNDENDLNIYTNHAGTAAADGDVVVMKGRSILDMPGWDDFLSAYQAEGFPNMTSHPGMFGVYAYDAAKIIIAAIDRADSTNPTLIRNEIAALTNHSGVMGTYIGFDSNGDVIPQWAWLVRYKNGQWLKQFPGQVFLPFIARAGGAP